MEEVDVDGQEGLTMTPDETSQTIKPKSLSMLISKCFDHYFQFMLRFYIQG